MIRGYQYGGPDKKDYSFLGQNMGVPRFLETTMSGPNKNRVWV